MSVAEPTLTRPRGRPPRVVPQTVLDELQKNRDGLTIVELQERTGLPEYALRDKLLRLEQVGSVMRSKEHKPVVGGRKRKGPRRDLWIAR